MVSNSVMTVTKEDLVAFMSQNEWTDGKDSFDIAAEKKWDHTNMVGIIKSLSAAGAIRTEQRTHFSTKLTTEAEQIVSKGSSEVRLCKALLSHPGFTREEAQEKLLEQDADLNVNLGFKNAMKKKWITQDKATKIFTVTATEAQLEVDEDRVNLQKLDALDNKTLADLKKKKYVQDVNTTSFAITKEEDFSTKCLAKKLPNTVTEQMIRDGSWKDTSFKPINFNAMGSLLPAGQLHPLLKVREHYRRAFFQMGFSEMPTNAYVESGFWNFDALYQPQQHPARDAHDTFFLKEPVYANESLIPKDYLERVKKMHEEGGSGSTGWRYVWSKEESLKNLMRTHTTAVTARVLYKYADSIRQNIAENKGHQEWKPMKCFSVDRVFRNETVDATHLAEFHQAEGLVVGKGITLGHLIGTFKEFFRHLDIEDLKFKAAYNPYTEPSMEIFGYHKGLKKWMEIGNSGMFRPEMLIPMGFPEDVRVLGWGLSLERPTMMLYGIKNIRDLFSEKLDVEKTSRKNPVCWFKPTGDHVQRIN